MTADQFDVIVIGAGMAGMNAADRAVAAGCTVAVVERDRVGGTCPVRGCIPTKALIASAEVAHQARRADRFGVRVGAVEVDFSAVMERVRAIIDRGSTGAREWLESLEGLELIIGEARMDGPGKVRVGDRRVSAERIIVATGAVPAIPPIAGLDNTPHLTSDDVLKLEELPERLLVIGAGPVALELGQALMRLGSRVTIVEVNDAFLPSAEPELADELLGHLRAEGLVVHLGATIERAEESGSTVRLHVIVDDQPRMLEGDALLVATGRIPALESLELDRIGLSSDADGLPVDGALSTGATGVWAAGDVLESGWGRFTHTARRHGVHAAEAALGLGGGDLARDHGPSAIFTDPELVQVGLTERRAREAGHDVSVGRAGFGGGRARAIEEERGAARVIVDRRDGRILGAHVLGHHAADLIHPVVVAMQAEGDAVDHNTRAFHNQPPLGEVVKTAVERAGSE